MPGELDIFFNLTTIKNPLHPIQQHDTNYKSITLPIIASKRPYRQKKKISSVENETGQTETIIRQEVNRFREFLFSKKKKKKINLRQTRKSKQQRVERKKKRRRGRRARTLHGDKNSSIPGRPCYKPLYRVKTDHDDKRTFEKK